MEYLHSQQPPILHRDFKSQNMVLEDPFLYIIDLGAAEAYAEPVPGDKKYKIGTRGWCSPEAAQGDHSVKSDVYSFGILLYELATLTPPPVSQDALTATEPSPTLALPYFPDLEQLYYECVAKDPRKRPNMSAILERLRRMEE